MSADLSPATRLARGARVADDPHGASSPPLYQTATFTQERPDAFGDFDYSRTDNPTRRAVEGALADAEGAARALTYSSGMAALSAVLRLARPGERVVLGADLYGGTQRLAHRYLDGVAVEHVDLAVDGGGAAALERSLRRAPARIVLAETPSNPRLRVTDVRLVAEVCRAHGARLAVDATAMTPWLMQPLALGADLVVHSATKGLAGHGDVTAGVVCVDDAALAEDLAARRNAEGNALAPFESWLLARGLETLAVRVERAQETAATVARALRASGRFAEVSHLSFDDHPGAAVHRAQASGAGALVALRTRDANEAERVVERTRLLRTQVSFGGTTSSISIPHHMSHASVPPGAAPRPEPELVRLSIGLEDPRDLVRDLIGALDEGTAAPLHAPGRSAALAHATDELL